MKKSKLSIILFVGITLTFCTISAYASPPRVVKTIPENGDQNVETSLRQIRIEFDQDMSLGGYSVCGGGPKYPKTIGKPKWINKRTLVMRVKLQPSHEYELSVNCQSYRNFKNLKGESAVIYPIKFKTNAAGEKVGTTTKSPSLLLQEGLYAENTEGDLEKAISLYEQVLEQYKDVERLAARATYQLGMCYLKKGDKEKAAEYFDEVVNYYPEQTTVVKKAQSQLDKMGISKVRQGNIFEILGPEVCSYIGSKYGEVCAEAGMKQLYSNSHIYLVDNDFVLRGGGMGYVYNLTGKPITEHHRLSGTSYPDQKLYSISGDEMDIEIVPDENRNNFYNVYWNPEKPLQPGEFFNYGWALDGTKQLSTTGAGGKYSLTMQNNLGQYAYETFFLAVPQGTVLSDQSEEYTGKGTVNNWDIYWWKKEVPPNTDHTVNLILRKAVTIESQKAAENLAAEGWKLWGQRKLTEAESKFKEAIAKNPEAEGAYQGLGWAQLNQGKKLNAKDSFEKCIKLNPQNSAALNGLGWIAHGQGDINEAIQWWEKAVEAQPGATASLSGLTQVYMEKKEYDKAIKYYEMWLKAEPDNKQAKEGLEKAKASNKN